MVDPLINGTVRAVMTERVLAIVPNADLETALRLMTSSGVHHLPVIDGTRCVGLLHEVDVLWSLWTHGMGGRTTASVCRRPAALVAASEPVTTAAIAMRRCDTDAALVMDAGRIIGIVTATDLVDHLAAVRIVQGRTAGT